MTELTQEEIINIVKDNLSFLKQSHTYKNFLLQLKKNKFSLISHFKFVNELVKKTPKQKREEKLVKLMLQAELADMMFRAGATIVEVIEELNIPKPVLSYLLRSYYNELPKEILQYKVMQYRLYQVITGLKEFVTAFVDPKLNANQSVLANGILSSMIDMVTATSKEKAMLDLNINDI
jgi:hypothetical protein